MQKQHHFHISMGWQILIGLTLGIISGVVFYQNKAAITVMSNLGSMFIGLIQMIVLPIIVSCLIVGIANMGDLKKLGRVGGKTIIYFEVMTTIALALGLLVGNVFHPGTSIDINKLHAANISQYVTASKSAASSGVWGFLESIIPTNIFKALGDGNMLAVIFFSILFGIGTAAIGERGKIILNFFQAISEVMFKITNWIMKLAPIGVFGLIGNTIAQMGIRSLLPLGYFILLAYATMAVFVAVFMSLAAHLFHINFKELLRVIKDEAILAFTTSSSEVTLPRMMNKMEDYGVDRSIVSLVIPTGYSFNLDGGAIYQSMAVLFLAQAYHINMSLWQQITILVVLMITTKGTAGVPSANFVVLLATLPAVGIPASGLAFIAGIDRLVDMGRTCVNVIGNSLATAIIGRSEHEFDDQKRQQYVAEHLDKN
ncbi:Na+ H+-dicarboxylate symporter [Lactobacillus selangorensis]|uniref:Na+ H+-dicarboxylate symporter n=1 Tax=Lactobacillus selangorensis TaxID=81857 RepID=A0A0R2FJ28_9LACO|nr:cation:dicarboxylase symporter family transporter [Lactobacillus selangorensis]KRN28674.1 Na+ H+-dicarboxylate symporter [Lactobacillus selangorensis]KRN32916.1 Na+ H+-dicarboxylate symporter [Lactobacillus selangorensis]